MEKGASHTMKALEIEGLTKVYGELKALDSAPSPLRKGRYSDY